MSNICKTVSLRTRPIKNGTQLSFYLDYYPGYRDNETMKVVRHESLGIYIYAKPKSQREKDYNARMAEKAEALRCRRFESIVNEKYAFFDKEKMKGDFLEYFAKLAAKKNTKWEHAYKHFHTFVQGKCSFGEINVDLCNKFREYLLNAPQGLHKNRKLHVNSAAGYWSTFRACLHTAYRDHKIKENPNGYLERIDTIPTDREHLSQDELIRLAATPCQYDVLKRGFLFATLTGLRKSDISKLTYEEIQPYGSDGMMYVTTRMQKTKDIVHNPVGDEALELIDYHPDKRGLVFPEFRDKMTQAPLKNWINAANITKHITFHCARHTFACLQLDAGTSMKVVQQYLGHKNISTTEIYAKLTDMQKRASVGRITLKKAE